MDDIGVYCVYRLAWGKARSLLKTCASRDEAIAYRDKCVRDFAGLTFVIEPLGGRPPKPRPLLNTAHMVPKGKK